MSSHDKHAVEQKEIVNLKLWKQTFCTYKSRWLKNKLMERNLYTNTYKERIIIQELLSSDYKNNILISSFKAKADW